MNWFARAYRDSQDRLRRRRRVDFFTLLFVSILLPSLGVYCFLYGCRTARTEKICALEEMQRQRIRLQSEQDDLSRALAELSSRKRIVHYASERLGMRFPRQEDVVLIVFDREPGEAAGSSEPVTGTSDGLAAPARTPRGKNSPIHALTRFFALYVF